MQISELDAPPRKKRKRVGRGPGSGTGKTAGRGYKGQKSRSGYKSHPWFEGGQMPLQRRVPKRGFHSRNKVEFQLVNVDALDLKFENGQTVDGEALESRGLIKHADRAIKILGTGNLTKKLTVLADHFSKSAEEKIRAAGGQVQVRQTQSGANQE